jgi:hypothetical protein
MKLRGIYFKVINLEEATEFWQKFFNASPRRTHEKWCEFKVGTSYLTLTTGERASGSNCLPIFEYTDIELPYYVDKAKSLGATEVKNSSKTDAKSVTLCDPFGNQFELTRLHD